MFGLTFEKLVLIGIVAAFLLGPERLPRYTQQLGVFVRRFRDYASGAKDRMRDEIGPEFDEVDWKKLDPRQYDPRRIIRDALLDEPPTAAAKISPAASTQQPASARPATPRSTPLVAGAAAPFDSEAT